ncbi:MAG: hypothetical protein ACREP8_03235, partial [Candidatus Binatia bacterium]
ARDRRQRLYRSTLRTVSEILEGMQTLLASMAQRDPRAKEAKAEQFIDSTSLREIERSGFVSALYQK